VGELDDAHAGERKLMGHGFVLHFRTLSRWRERAG